MNDIPTFPVGFPCFAGREKKTAAGKISGRENAHVQTLPRKLNLVPRALEAHRKYQSEFQDYPKQRKAIVPWLL